MELRPRRFTRMLFCAALLMLPTPAALAQTAVYRINVAGEQFTDSQNRVWTADSNFTGGGIFTTTQPISGTVDDALYQKERFGNFTYALPLQNGTYDVVLHLAEIWWNAAGQRVFDVTVEGAVALDNVDVWAEAGQFAALTKTVPATVSDGVLNIGFVSVVDNAKVAAIEVIGTGTGGGGGTGQWTTAAPLPVARYEAPSLTLNGKVYVFGGFSSWNGSVLAATAQVHVYDPAANTWTLLTTIPGYPSGISHHSIAIDRDKFVWVVAGFAGADGGPAVSTVWKYDIAANTWSAGPNLPAARGGGGLARVGRQLHYIGGTMADRNTDAGNHWVLDLDAASPSWTSLAPLPTPRTHFSTVVVNGKIYTLAGQHNHDVNPFDTAIVEVYNPATNAWSTAASMPAVRSHFEPGTFVRDGRIVAVGGKSGSTQQLTNIVEYDPTTNTWTNLTPLPVALRAPVAQAIGSEFIVAGGGVTNGFTPTTTTYRRTVPATNGSWSALAALFPGRAETGVAAAGGKVYVVGGKDANDALLSAVSVYDPVTNSWSTAAPVPGPARDHIGVVSVDDKIYAIGGLTGWPGPSVANVFMYDPANAATGWVTKASLPVARGAMGVAVVNGKIYAAGGLSNSVAVNHLTVYDPLTNAWTTLAPMPTVRDHLTAESLNGKLYAFGGRNTSITAVTNAAEVYNPATNSWSTLAPMPTARGSIGSGILGGRIFVFGADTGTSALALNQEYDPATNTWRTVTPMITPRSSIGGAVVSGRIYVPGGKGQDGGHDLSVNEAFVLGGSTSSPTNQAPVANAGPDQTITLPGAATLTGSATDDGLPNPPGALTYTWTKFSGPGTVTFANATAASTSATFSAAGSYTLRLTASDSALSDTDDVVITVNGGGTGGPGPFQEQSGQVVMEAENFHATITRGGKSWSAQTTPAGFAGVSAMQSLPNSGTTIDTGFTTTATELQYQVQFATAGTYHVWIRGFAATTSDNSYHVGLNGQAVATADRGTLATLNSWAWTKSTSDGPVATLVVASAGLHTINVWMREDGLYVDRLLLTTSSSLVPSGTGPAESPRAGGGSTNQPPVVNAGADQTVTLPGAATLSGSATDDGLPDPPGALTYAWTKFSGPGTVTFANAAAASTSATFSAAGSYTLRLTVSDSALSGTDDVAITVNGGGTGGTGPFQEQSGQVVMEAESFHATVARGGKSWSAQTTPAGFAGASAMQSLPNSGTTIDTGFATTATELQYQVQFATAGTYHVWIRGFAATTSDNSYHVGLNGQAATTADRGSLATLNSWAWTKSTSDGPVATLAIASAGLHTINLWMREDGLYVDRLLLTTSSTLVPSGTGPAESPRSGGGTVTPTCGTSTNPTLLNFSGTVPATYGGTGFNCFMPGTSQPDGTGLTLSGINSHLVVASSDGDIFQTPNTAENALALKFANTGTYSVRARIKGPFNATVAFQSSGVFLALGADNYAKLVVGQGSSGMRLEFGVETGASFTTVAEVAFAPGSLDQASEAVDLWLVRNTSGGIQALYRTVTNLSGSPVLGAIVSMGTAAAPSWSVSSAELFGGIVTTDTGAGGSIDTFFDEFQLGGAVNSGAAPSPISFITKTIAKQGTTSGTAFGISGFDNPTSLDLGPSGQLFVATQLGKIYILTLDPQQIGTPSGMAVTHVQTLNQIFNRTTLTCNIGGNPNNCQVVSGSPTGRQVTGLAVGPESTAQQIVLYVTHSDPRIGNNSSATAMAIDTWSSTVTRLTLQPGTGGNYTVTSDQDLVVGLPRSRENHSINGMTFGSGGWMYFTVAGHTNFGKPSTFFSMLPERYLSAAVLRLNLTALDSQNLPLNVKGVTSASGMTPFAGVLELYSTGYRNAYDLVWHGNGQLYLNENAGNAGLGNTPDSADGCNTPSINPGTLPDTLHRVLQGSYGGHPDPVRGECVLKGGTSYNPALSPDSDYLPSLLSYNQGASTNGIVEYVSNAFGGQMQGNLISATYAGNQNVRRVVLNGTGTAVAQEVNLGAFDQPLDVTTDTAGIIYVAEHGGNQITVLIPEQAATCPDPGTTDDDDDGFSDTDEGVHATDPCNEASFPPDLDGDFVGDLSDSDLDGDTVSNTTDQLNYDPQNGANTTLPLAFEWNPGDAPLGGIAETGFTGAQIASSGVRINTAAIRVGAAGGFMSLTTGAGTAQGASNNQVNALQVGFDSTAPFTVWSRIAEPFNSVTAATGHVGAIFFGPSQNNFLRLGIVGGSGGEKAIQLGLEQAGAFTEVARVSLGTGNIVNLDLILVGDPASQTISAYYDLSGTGSRVLVGEAAGLPASWFSNNEGTAGGTSLAGLMTSHGTAAQTTFVYDFFRIQPTGSDEPATFVEQGGQVVMEAEHFVTTISRGGKSWSAQTTPTGFAGAGAMQALPNSGTTVDTGFTTTAAELQYQVQFATAGTYHVWIRGFAATTSDNSYHVGLNGQAVATADRGNLATLNSWAWTKSTSDGPVATISIGATGLHTVNVWMREDGLSIDRLLLTTNASFAPSGTGPPESVRQ